MVIIKQNLKLESRLKHKTEYKHILNLIVIIIGRIKWVK